MKAKLFKHGHSYALVLDEKLVAFAHPEDFRSDTEIGKLSLKNCQAIERGYDLDELAKRHHKLAYIQAYNPEIAPYVEADYKAGAEMIIKLLGDKKFSEEDLKWLNDAVQEKCYNDQSMNTSVVNKLKSLQQTEWDVEIVTEEVNIGDKYTPDPKPLLDSEGCLILKRKV